jgi:hypothetical protein
MFGFIGFCSLFPVPDFCKKSCLVGAIGWLYSGKARKAKIEGQEDSPCKR